MFFTNFERLFLGKWKFSLKFIVRYNVSIAPSAGEYFVTSRGKFANNVIRVIFCTNYWQCWARDCVNEKNFSFLIPIHELVFM